MAVTETKKPKSLFELYETNIDLEKEGVWVEMAEGVRFKIARFGNDNHVKLLENLKTPYKNQYRKGTMDSVLDEQIACRAAAKEIIKDWRGVVGKDGKEIPYSADEAYKLLSNPALKDLKADVIFIATEAATFKTKEAIETEKNLEKSSDGN